jgi:hypothetical protein
MTSARHRLPRARWLSLAAGGVALLVAALFGPLRAHASGSQLLPDIVAEPPADAELATERFDGGPERLVIKFNGYLHNVGSGALDMEGNREAPHLSSQGKQELEKWQGKHGELPPKLKEELASPPMHLSQNIFTTAVNEEKEIEREHIKEPREHAEMVYSDADGHNHWHLQHMASYSLWNEARSEKVAPSQKVGFCLEDSEHTSGFGPSEPIYTDAVRGGFCEQFKPEATHLREGISRGWRDYYEKTLAFQWVDVSEVQPGHYWLREDVDPEGVVKEEGPAKVPSYSNEEVTLPGFVAEPQSVKTAVGAPVTVTLKSAAYAPREGASYSVVSPPGHGKLSGSGSRLEYTPEAGFSGTDTFTFTAREPNNKFPLHPEEATVSIQVGEPVAPSLTITSAPAGMTAGTSAPLSAQASNYAGSIEWSASAGTITPSAGQSVTFTAPGSPPPGESVTVTARLAGDAAVSASRQIAIAPVPAPLPGPDLPTGNVASEKVVTPPHISRPRAMLVGSELVLSATPGLAGRIRLSAYLGKHLLGDCDARTPAGRRFVCRIRLRPARIARDPIRVVARAGGWLYRHQAHDARGQAAKGGEGGPELADLLVQRLDPRRDTGRRRRIGSRSALPPSALAEARR